MLQTQRCRHNGVHPWRFLPCTNHSPYCFPSTHLSFSTSLSASL